MPTSTRALMVKHSVPKSTRITLGTHSPLESMQLRQERSDVYTAEGKHIQDSSLTLTFQINEESGLIKMLPVGNIRTGISDSDLY